MKARKKEMFEVQHPRMTNVFDQRSTKQSQELMELRSRDLENDSDWYVWRFYVDTVAIQVGRLRTLIKDLDDKLDEQGASLCKGKLKDWVFEYRENKQALLHNVDLMLDLTNEATQRQLGRSVTEWEQFFAQLEDSWGYWFPDVKTMLKNPKHGTDKKRLRQVASGTCTDATMRCTHTRKLKQSSFNRTKRNCSVEVSSEKKSLGQSSRVTDEERRVVGASNPSDVIKSISDVKVLPEQSIKGSVKATSKSNRTTASSKSSNAKRLLLLELEAMKKQDEIDERLAAARRKAEIRKKQGEIDMRILTEELEIAKLGEETARAKQVLKNYMDSARNEMQLTLTQSEKVTKQLQPSEGPQKCYRTFKASSTSMKPPTGAERRGQSSHSRNNMNEVTNKESHLRSNKEPCFGRTGSRSIVGSHWRSNQKSVENCSMMRTVKQTQTKQTSSKQNSSDHNESLKRKDELLGKQEERASLKALDCTTKGKCTMKRWQHEQIKCSDMCPNHGKLQDKCGAHEGSKKTNVESDANKETSKRLAAEWMWNRPETFVVDNGWQDFRSGTLLVDTQQVLEEETHLVMSEHLIVQTEETLDYTMTETMKEHRSLAFTSNNETSEELSVQLELLQEITEVSTVLQKIQQGKLFQVTVFYDITLLPEERNKCYEFVKSYDFVNEQRYTLPEDLNEIVMHRKQCHVAMKHDKPAKGHAKIETQIVNATFGKKTDFDFNESLLEETIPSHSSIWNPWNGNGNSGMDAVAQANVIDETQLSNGHRKQLKKRSWKIEHNWNLIQEMVEGAQLNVNGTPQDKPLWLHDLRDNLSRTRMQICSLKVPTATSWSNGSCNGPAAPFKTMWVQYGRFGKLEVSADLSEPVRNLDEKKLKFGSERSTVNLYKQKRKQNSTALQLFGENSNVATENDVSESRVLNVVQRLSLKLNSPPIGCKENIEHEGKNSSRSNVGNFLHLLVMMMDDSIISHERQIDCLNMKRLENELSLTYLPRRQSTLMRKYVAEQILGNCMETFSTHLEIFSLDVEVIMEVELNVLKQFCIIPVKSSREKELVEHNKCRTLMTKIGMMGKTITSNKTTVFWKYFVLCQLVDNNCMVREMDYGLEKHCSRETTQQTTGNYDYGTEILRKTTMTDDNLRPPVMRLSPMFYECVFREKNRAGNVGASHQQAKKLDSERAG